MVKEVETSKCNICGKESCVGLCSGKCMRCDETTIMYSYLASGFLCLKHYNKFIKSINVK